MRGASPWSTKSWYDVRTLGGTPINIVNSLPWDANSERVSLPRALAIPSSGGVTLLTVYLIASYLEGQPNRCLFAGTAARLSLQLVRACAHDSA